jgi:biopolymer transport protein TolR
MTQLPSRTRVKLRREQDRIESEMEESSEINLVPYLDIVTNILLFLLVTISTMLVIGNLDVTVPDRSRSAAVAQKSPEPEVPDLNLTVAITDSGFIVAGSGGVLYENDVPGKLPTVPRIKGGAYNYDSLQKLIVNIKKQHPMESQAILAANPDIQYETVIGVMDVLRMGPSKETLFPQVLFSTGFQ